MHRRRTRAAGGAALLPSPKLPLPPALRAPGPPAGRAQILQSLAHGVPVVATPVAAEGLGLVDGASGLVGTTAAEFVAKCVEAYSDCTLWRTLVRGGAALLTGQLSGERGAAALLAAFAEVGSGALPASDRARCRAA